MTSRLKAVVVVSILEDILRSENLTRKRAARELMARMLQGQMPLDEVYETIKTLSK